VIRGGSWSDATYMFGNLSQLPQMDRSPQNGFRTAYYPEPDKIPGTAFETIELPNLRDIEVHAPVSDEVFAAFKERFAYDRVDLEARVDARYEDNEFWIRETVSYNAAYGGERILAHLFLPKSTSPPYQTVLYFPGSGAVLQGSSAQIEEYFEVPIFISFLVKNGRAVLFPVYQGTFERQESSIASFHIGEGSHRYTEFLVHLVKDFSRSVDYLETREDVDADRLAYYGLSWGASLGGTILAIEERLRASVLVSGGLAVRHMGRSVAFRPEADPMNYLPRVRVPTLMINGRYDMILPLESAIRPMFELLGPAPDAKELLLYDTDHIPPRTEFIKETLAWLDKYLGPVRR
jgi:dipeptidyl aminopeptidase/acylaminoacyl peptidase